ncbi:HEAT repeat domain-containing protein [Limnoglobus roseus]|uniref:HEAT repeat domain-containing protein n=1 Tax=Limnoglobus roseus TaxID=2598579 RepID=A0A5C1A4A0_9BACT|nr:HEAT repeat domain-containing protein [Limnoglobus roseus]QEL13185.1 hypothetical protein PX52LOC_00038 [Limnoglobus roseus]
MVSKRWVGRILGLTVLTIGGLAAFNWTILRAHYAASRLRSATTDEARSQQAQALLDLGDDGFAQLVESLKGGDGPTCQTIGGVLRKNFAAQSADTTAFVQRASALLDTVPALGESGQEAVLQLLPELLKSSDAGVTGKCRAAVERGLQSSSRAKVFAARLCGMPQINLVSAVPPLLTDAEAEVRAAALTALSTTGDASIISDEELFHWMNDPDANVRHICAAVLQTRGRSADEIDFGRRLTHPQARVRLQLLVELASESGRDIGPWLERLSRDAEPAVRAGAVRVASERKLLYTDWADNLAVSDPNPLVRQVATFHRRKAAGLLSPAGYSP